MNLQKNPKIRKKRSQNNKIAHMTRDDYRLLGSIVKTRGISGEVVVRSSITTQGINENQKHVMIKIDGLLVPFFIISWQSLSNKEIILKFRDIETKEKAEKLKDNEIYLHRTEISNANIRSGTDDLSGYQVIDVRAGIIGKSTGIMEIPGNELLQVEYRKREILLPIQEGLILEIDSKKKLIRVDLPIGFLEI
jgi:16S rRNA processing protein RimM